MVGRVREAQDGRWVRGCGRVEAGELEREDEVVRRAAGEAVRVVAEEDAGGVVPSLIREKTIGPESSGWLQPLQAPNDCAWTPKLPLQGLVLWLLHEPSPVMLPLVCSQSITSWSRPLWSSIVGSSAPGCWPGIGRRRSLVLCRPGYAVRRHPGVGHGVPRAHEQEDVLRRRCDAACERHPRVHRDRATVGDAAAEVLRPIRVQRRRTCGRVAGRVHAGGVELRRRIRRHRRVGRRVVVDHQQARGAWLARALGRRRRSRRCRCSR